MTETIRAVVIRKAEDGRQSCGLEAFPATDLMAGDTTVAVDYSTLNYKDGLAITGAGPIARTFPLIPGIDFAGTVVSGGGARFKPGDKVVLNGFGVGETHHGGLAGRACVPSDWLIALPPALTSAQAMAIGTAGYTASLCAIALREAGVEPNAGEILVTGAAGGVGSIAIALLSRLGYRVVASSRRAEQEGAYLTGLGAADIIDATPLTAPGRPLVRERWAGAVDSVGSHTLVNVLAATRARGVVTACGLAQGSDLPGTVMPFILRGVSLIGINSVTNPIPEREAAWALLAETLDGGILERIGAVTIGLDDVPRVAAELLAGTVRGRVVVRL